MSVFQGVLPHLAIKDKPNHPGLKSLIMLVIRKLLLYSIMFPWSWKKCQCPDNTVETLKLAFSQTCLEPCKGWGAPGLALLGSTSQAEPSTTITKTCCSYKIVPNPWCSLVYFITNKYILTLPSVVELCFSTSALQSRAGAVCGLPFHRGSVSTYLWSGIKR